MRVSHEALQRRQGPSHWSVTGLAVSFWPSKTQKLWAKPLMPWCINYLDASIIAWSNLRLGFLVPVFGHVAYLVWISWQLGEKKKHPLLLCFPAAGSSSSCQEHSTRIVTGNQAWACSCMPENECLNLNASTCFAACNTPLRETDTPPPPPPPPQPLPEPSQPSAAKATPIANKTPGNLKFLSPRESF